MPRQTFGPTGPTQFATVTTVTDGDTIRVSVDGVEYPVRYIGIDSPETDATDPIARRLAGRATAANELLVSGQEVILERDVSEVDRFDRLLRHVWLVYGEQVVLVNEELVRLGFAQVSTFPPDVKYIDRLIVAQEIATSTSAGMWAPEPTPTASPTPSPSPTPTPTRAATVDGSRVVIADASRAAFRGVAGLYRYTALKFPLDRMTLRWSVTASADQDCRASWRIQPTSGKDIAGSVAVAAGTTETGSQRYSTAFSAARFIVDSKCPNWLLTMQGIEAPRPTPRPTIRPSGSNCHPSYRGVCLKRNAGDYDCAGGSGNGPNYVAGPVRVVGYDEFDLDRDSDGIGCE